MAQVTDYEAATRSRTRGGKARRRVARFLELKDADASLTVMDLAGAAVRSFRICGDYLEFRSDAQVLPIRYRDVFGHGARIGESTIRIASDSCAIVGIGGLKFNLQVNDGWFVLREDASLLSYCGVRNLQLWAANDVAAEHEQHSQSPVPYAVSIAAGTGGKQDVLFSRAVPMRGVFGKSGRLLSRDHICLSGRNSGRLGLLAAAVTLFGASAPGRETPKWLDRQGSGSEDQRAETALALGDATALASVLSAVEAVQEYYRGP